MERPTMQPDAEAPEDAAIALAQFSALVEQEPAAAAAVFAAQGQTLTANQLIASAELARPRQGKRPRLRYETRVLIALGDVLANRHDLWAEYDGETSGEIGQTKHNIDPAYARTWRIATYVGRLVEWSGSQESSKQAA